MRRDHGRTFGFFARGGDGDLRMTRCALTPGLPMAMTGQITASGARHVTGTWRGTRVDRRG